MTKMLAFIAALLMTGVTVSSACVANSPAPLRFTIEQSRDADRLQISFKRADDNYRSNSWSSSFRPAELAGLDVATFRAAATRPIRFAIAREAGRVDCAGNGGNSMAIGTCSLVPDRGFNDFLASRGITRPTEEQTFGLTAVNARRELVTALAAANYPTPSVNKLMELSAVGVTPSYITQLARVGYRPASLQSLVEFGAMKITPEFIGSFARAGYSNLGPGDLVQLKALDITPEYIAGFERLGYRDLPVGTLVQLKAMNVTPEFVKAVQQGDALPSPDRLVQIRAVSRDIRN
ncbi:MAG: hypothetical protein ACR2JJ_10545 [Sphingomicrobium sp.]